jgi:hypothetical protein
MSLATGAAQVLSPVVRYAARQRKRARRKQRLCLFQLNRYANLDLPLAEIVFEIPSAICNCHNFHARLEHSIGDGRPAFKSDGAQSGLDVIAASATLWKLRESHACGLYPVDISTRDLGASHFGDIFVETNQVSFGLGPEGDLKRHAWRL